jgi:hypothetical protein
VAERWTSWRSFRDAKHGDYLEAPIGPGIYEIRRASDRESLKLACTTNIANALSVFCKPGKRRWRFLFRTVATYAPGELEYRFWSHVTPSEAKIALEEMLEQRAMVGVPRGTRHDKPT